MGGGSVSKGTEQDQLGFHRKLNAVKTKIFVSFDFDHDHDLKGSLVAQAQDPKSPFELIDFSLVESQPQHEWLSRAQSSIARCDVFVVILGLNTHQAPGVRKEVQIAKGLRKDIETCKKAKRPVRVEGVDHTRKQLELSLFS